MKRTLILFLLFSLAPAILLIHWLDGQSPGVYGPACWVGPERTWVVANKPAAEVIQVTSGWRAGVSDRTKFRTCQNLIQTTPAKPAGLLGLTYVSGRVNFGAAGTAQMRTLVVPHWMPLALSSIPLLWFITRVIRKSNRAEVAYYRRQYDLCASCGYDLRGSPGRCPECGQIKQERNKAAFEI